MFKFERWGVCYGTDDKGHAAAIILSVFLLLVMLLLFAGGFLFEREWVSDAIQIIATAFTFVAGVAIGKGMESSNKEQ